MAQPISETWNRGIQVDKNEKIRLNRGGHIDGIGI